MGQGNREQRLGSQVLGLGFRSRDSGFRVQGLGYRVQGSGYRVHTSGLRHQTSGCRARLIQAARYQPSISGSGFRVGAVEQIWHI